MRAPIDRTPRHIPYPPAPKQGKPSFDELDQNGDGSISEQEYTVRPGENILSLKKGEMKRRGEEFDKIDLNNDGKVSKLELFIDRIRDGRDELADQFDEVFPQLQDVVENVLPGADQPQSPFHNHTDCK